MRSTLNAYTHFFCIVFQWRRFVLILFLCEYETRSILSQQQNVFEAIKLRKFYNKVPPDCVPCPGGHLFLYIRFCWKISD